MDHVSFILGAFLFLTAMLAGSLWFTRQRRMSIISWEELAKEYGEPFSNSAEEFSLAMPSMHSFKYKGHVVSFTPRPLTDMLALEFFIPTNLFFISCSCGNQCYKINSGKRSFLWGRNRKAWKELKLSLDTQEISNSLGPGYITVNKGFISYEPFFPSSSKEYKKKVLDDLLRLAESLEK